MLNSTKKRAALSQACASLTAMKAEIETQGKTLVEAQHLLDEAAKCIVTAEANLDRVRSMLRGENVAADEEPEPEIDQAIMDAAKSQMEAIHQSLPWNRQPAGSVLKAVLEAEPQDAELQKLLAETWDKINEKMTIRGAAPAPGSLAERLALDLGGVPAQEPNRHLSKETTIQYKDQSGSVAMRINDAGETVHVVEQPPQPNLADMLAEARGKTPADDYSPVSEIECAVQEQHRKTPFSLGQQRDEEFLTPLSAVTLALLDKFNSGYGPKVVKKVVQYALAGKSHQEISDLCGLSSRHAAHSLISRMVLAGIIPEHRSTKQTAEAAAQAIAEPEIADPAKPSLSTLKPQKKGNPGIDEVPRRTTGTLPPLPSEIAAAAKNPLVTVAYCQHRVRGPRGKDEVCDAPAVDDSGFCPVHRKLRETGAREKSRRFV